MTLIKRIREPVAPSRGGLLGMEVHEIGGGDPRMVEIRTIRRYAVDPTPTTPDRCIAAVRVNRSALRHLADLV